MKIAVVGAGISGLSCAWLLSKYSSLASAPQVTLFEKNDYLGGHTNTIDVHVDGKSFPVDTGFLVFNDWTYPNFIQMLQHLGVHTAQSDMSFGIKLTDSSGRSRIEWCGSDDIFTVFAQPSNLFKPAFLGMLWDLLRFNKAGKDALNSFAEGDELKMMLMGLKRFTKTEPFNPKTSRQLIAQALINENRYTL